MDVMQNLDAERAILGLAMHDSACAQAVAAMEEGLWTDSAHQAVQRAIRRMVQRGDKIDLVSLCAECACDVQEPEAMLIDCASRGISPVMLPQYESILHGCKRRRNLAAVSQEIAALCADPSADPDALAQHAAAQLTQGAADCRAIDMPGALMEFVDAIDNAKTGRVYTGLAALDRLTGGLRGGKMVVLGARPGVGKTALALQMAVHAARHTGPVLLVSLEMDAAEIVSRMVAAESGVDLQALEAGELTEEQAKRASACYPAISALPIRMAQHTSTPMQVRREAMAMQNSVGLSMVVIDYLQLMRSDEQRKSRYEEVTSISREIKLLAMDLHVPILALSQFNRQSEGGYGKKKSMPTMAEAKDSGAIEQDANLFLVQYAPEEPAEDGPDWQAYHMCKANGWEWQVLKVEKNRQGRTGAIPMAFDKARMNFKTIDTKEGSM